MSQNDPRISNLAIMPTVPRQTPQNDFGTVMARTASEVVRVGTGLVGGMVPSGGILSASVSSVASLASSVSGAAAVPGGGSAGMGAGSGVAAGGSAGPAGGARGKGDQWDMLEAQRLMQSEGQKFNVAYLQLQNEMQRESREHNAISNIMKVRHDSAKAAINNIR